MKHIQKNLKSREITIPAYGFYSIAYGFLIFVISGCQKPGLELDNRGGDDGYSSQDKRGQMPGWGGLQRSGWLRVEARMGEVIVQYVGI
jgi:hypothetical protein